MGAYSERDYIKREQAKRATIEAALNLFGWPVMYKTLRDRGYTTLQWEENGNTGHVMVTLRSDFHPSIPGWKLAAYDALFEPLPYDDKGDDRG